MDRNIFDAAAKKLRKKSNNKQNPPNRRASSAAASLNNETGGQNLEVNEMLQRMKSMQQDLDNQMAELRRKGRLYNIDIDLYIENLTRHYPQEMNKVTQEQKELLDSIDSLFTPETCIKPNPKSKEKLTKERKSKTVPFRKKWIPMG